MRYLFFIFISFLLIGCYGAGHKAWVLTKNDKIGTKAYFLKPYKDEEDIEEVIRGDFLTLGKGLTHVTKDKEGNIITHWDSNEVLPNFAEGWGKEGKKKWVGKCKYYYVIDPNTHIIKNWGFDGKDTNPQSCRIWP